MSTENQNMPSEVDPAATGEVDPLSGAASGWEPPRFPLLCPDRLCEVEIKSCVKKPTKEDKTKELLEIIVATTKDYDEHEPTTPGQQLRAGYKLTTWIGISEYPAREGKRGRTLKQVGADLAVVLRATLGGSTTKTPRNLINSPSIIEGCKCVIRTGVRKGEGNYGDSNTIKFIPPEN
jgi:hypothetical protein